METAPAAQFTPLWYGVGAVLAIMIGAAVGQSFIAEHGRKLTPYVVGGTVVLALVLGWAMNTVMTTLYAPAFVH
ncbi:MAG: hypothetical protein WCE44_07800 [Candidatus Velthaea sp.]|jgi:hypothetical protein